jgi:hypothetical protein
MIYELRIYRIQKGKMPELHKLAYATFDILRKHNIHVCDFFADADGASKIYYICAFEDKESMEVAWDSFVEDPLWQKTYAAHCTDGPLIEEIESYLMNRVPYKNSNWK